MTDQKTNNAEIGEFSGRYRILQKIGAGGMGEVFLAEDTRLERKVALKLLPETFAQDRERMLRFVREAKSASALNHPNIITIYEIGETDRKHYIATEYIEGETLRRRLEKDSLSLSEVLNAALQTAEALNAAHAAGIIHRDIKPENIMVRRDGIVKVLDFGLAKLTEKKEANLDTEAETRALVQTNPGVVMGTVAYMSPEQARGKDTDARTDIWSLGCVLYEMLAGKMPFTGETTSDVIAAILTKEPPTLDAAKEEIPAELERILRKTLCKDREERYQTSKDLLIDLKNLKRDLEIKSEIQRSSAPQKTIDQTATENTANKDAAQTISATEAVPTAETQFAHSTSSAEYVVSRVKKHKLGVAVGMAVLILTAVGFGVWIFGSRLSSSNFTPIQSIAVLPFENASGNADLDYLSDGVSESVIDRLSQLPQLKVIARSSSFRYRGQNLDLKQIADALGVDAIVTGRVVPRGDSYQIRVEMIDARSNQNLWSESFTRKVSDVQILQTDISRDIAENLRFRLSGVQTKKLASQGTTNPQAYELLLKGRYYFNKGGGQRGENFNKAAEYYEQAIAADPNYALAYAELSDAYGIGGGTVSDRKQRRIKQEAAARKALELDPNLADAHFAMAQSKRDNGEWAEAEHEYKRAIELNPNLAKVYSAYANYLHYMKRPDEAVAAIRRALELDPLSIIFNVNAIGIYYLARRYDEAIAAAKKAFELEPNNSTAHRQLGNVYEAKGMYQETLAEYREVLRLRELTRGEGPNFARVYAKMGERAKAEEILQKFKADGNNFGGRDFALLYDALGMRDEAFAELEKDYAENGSNLASIAADPLYDNLRSDPRFQDLLRRMNLPQ